MSKKRALSSNLFANSSSFESFVKVTVTREKERWVSETLVRHPMCCAIGVGVGGFLTWYADSLLPNSLLASHHSRLYRALALMNENERISNNKATMGW